MKCIKLVGLPTDPTKLKLMINEYGGGKAQNGPSSAAWWVANLERYQIAGCRSIECACCTDPNLSCMLQNASTTTGDQTTVQQAFTTTPIFDVYAAYASMTGDLVSVSIGPQSAPFDAVAAIDATEKTAWVLVGQAQNETGAYTSALYNATLLIAGLTSSSVVVADGKVNVTVGGSQGYPLETMGNFTRNLPLLAIIRVFSEGYLGLQSRQPWRLQQEGI